MKTDAEIEELLKNTERLAFLIRHGCAPNVDFHGNYFIIVTNKKNVECVIDDFDANRCIDKAMEYAKT
jgi:hypothetical protein